MTRQAMESTARCAFCGSKTAATSMDMTGNGWRCTPCTAKAEFANFQGRDAGMAEHLTRAELDTVVAQSKQQAALGGALIAGGVVGTALSVAAGAPIVIVFSGAIAAGIGMIAH